MIAHEFLELLRRIADAESRTRERGADDVTDLLSSYLPPQAAVLATVLSAAAASEADHAALRLSSTPSLNSPQPATLR